MQTRGWEMRRIPIQKCSLSNPFHFLISHKGTFDWLAGLWYPMCMTSANIERSPELVWIIFVQPLWTPTQFSLGVAWCGNSDGSYKGKQFLGMDAREMVLFLGQYIKTTNPQCFWVMRLSVSVLWGATSTVSVAETLTPSVVVVVCDWVEANSKLNSKLISGLCKDETSLCRVSVYLNPIVSVNAKKSERVLHRALVLKSHRLLECVDRNCLWRLWRQRLVCLEGCWWHLWSKLIESMHSTLLSAGTMPIVRGLKSVW